MENPVTTWKNDSQRRGKPRIGRRAMNTPRMIIILFFGILFDFADIIHALENLDILAA